MMEDIDHTNYVEYQTAPSMLWHPAKYSQPVVEKKLAEDFAQYMEAVQKSDCKAELRRRLADSACGQEAAEATLAEVQAQADMERAAWAEERQELRRSCSAAEQVTRL